MKKYVCLLFFAILVPSSYADNIVPRSGTTAQIAQTVGNNGEIAVDNQAKAMVIFDGKKKGGYYTAGASVTVVNSYNSYTTSNTINNSYTTTVTTNIYNDTYNNTYTTATIYVSGLWQMSAGRMYQVANPLGIVDSLWQIISGRIVQK
jgi:hypothetical protein